jgi:polysaccharide export outer membrane protein
MTYYGRIKDPDEDGQFTVHPSQQADKTCLASERTPVNEGNVMIILSNRRAVERMRSFLARLRPALVAGLSLLVCAGCGTGSNTLPGHASATTAVKLSAGDQIKLSFTAATDLNQSQKIRADGKVSLPLIGEVQAAGKTIPEFQGDLIRLYKTQLRNSDVLVTLENGTGAVVVSGAVGHPGKIGFDRPTTVFQVIMEAGGITDYGSLKGVRLFRTTNGEQQTQVLNLNPALKGKTSDVVYVKDGDVIYVPQSLF